MRIGFDFDFDFFNPMNYFLDLLTLSVILLPLFRFIKSRPAKRLLLGAAGAYLLFVTAPRLLLFYLLFWAVVWVGIAVVTAPFAPLLRAVNFAVFLVAVLSPLLLWKAYPQAFLTDFNVTLHHVVAALSSNLGEVDFIKEVFIPVGLSFTVFRGADLLIQAYIGLVGRLPLRDVLSFGFFPPALVVGPIIEYREVADDAEVGAGGGEDIVVGLQRILVGVIKVLVLAWPLQFSLAVIRNFNDFRGGYVLVCLVVFACFFYLNFSGYSDIALGTARLFGYRLGENFDFPYFQPNLQRFWASWHMSLTRFAQRNIFVPLGGYRKGAHYPALVATMLVIALWHDLSSAMVLFGLYHGAGLCALRYMSEKKLSLDRLVPDPLAARVLTTVATFTFVVASFPMLVLSTDRLPHFYRHLLS